MNIYIILLIMIQICNVKSSYIFGWMVPQNQMIINSLNTEHELKMNNLVPILINNNNNNNNFQHHQQQLEQFNLNQFNHIENNKKSIKYKELIEKSGDLSSMGLLGDDKLRCKINSDCLSINKEMYCDNHYGYCKESSKEGELCRQDNQCSSNLICMLGKCSVEKKSGQTGARCLDDSDCSTDHCCARLLGTKICKPKLKLNQKCFVPLGGLDYSLNESCPCVDGLYCQAVEHDNEPFPINKIIPKNPRIEHLKCFA